MTTIVTKNGSGAPLASDLVQGELAVDLTNKRLYTEDSGGTVIELGSNPTSLTTGTFTSTGIDDNATSTAITIDASENVGIGETTPSTTLTKASITTGLVAEGTVPGFCIQDTSGADNAGYWFQENGTMVFQNYGSGNTIFRTGSGGTETVRIDSSGFVGIGTDSPSTNLDVRSNISMGDGTSVTQLSMIRNSANYIAATNASGYLVFRTGGSNERMRIDSSGNVGIGTSNATPSNGEGLCIGSGSTITRIDMRNTTTGDATGDGTSLQLNGNNFTIENREAGYVAFSTSLTERVRIDSSGNVGIGTTSPSGGLHVKSSTNTVTFESTTNGLYNTFISTAGTFGYLGSGSQTVSGAATTDFGIQATTGNFVVATGGNTERMRIDSSGNVGIGTSSPNSKLTLSAGDKIFVPTGEALNFGHTDGSTNTERMRIDASGNVILNQSAGAADNTILRITGGTAGFSTLHLADTADDNVGNIQYNHTTNSLAFDVNNAERMRIDSSGNLLVGTTTAGGDGVSIRPRVSGSGTTTTIDFDRASSTTSGNVLLFQNGGSTVGSVTHNHLATTYNTSSDQRLKENIVDAPAGNIDDIRVRSFDWKADGSHQKYGMVAQELVDVAPEAVSQGATEDDMWGVDYSKLVPMMIKEIQDLRARVAQLEGA